MNTKWIDGICRVSGNECRKFETKDGTYILNFDNDDNGMECWVLGIDYEDDCDMVAKIYRTEGERDMVEKVAEAIIALESV